MTTHDELDIAIESYLLALERGEPRALQRTIASHPTYEHQLTAFALIDAGAATRPSQESLTRAGAEITPALRASILSRVFGHPVAAAEAAAPRIAGIFTQARAVGLNAATLASALDLPSDVVLQLDRRLLDVRSVPRRLLQRLATTLQTSTEALQAYLSGGPATRVAAFNFAAQAPRTEKQAASRRRWHQARCLRPSSAPIGPAPLPRMKVRASDR